MKFNSNILPTLLASFTLVGKTVAFSPIGSSRQAVVSSSSALKVSIGLGPDAEEEKAVVVADEAEEKEPLVEPDHELFRDSRLTDFDRKCDSWFASLLGPDDKPSFLGEVSEDAQRRIRTLHKLERNVRYLIGFDFVLFVCLPCSFLDKIISVIHAHLGCIIIRI